MCGNFEGKISGDPAIACWCHCTMCRQQTGGKEDEGWGGVTNTNAQIVD
jgi:hypothetical protein